MDHRTDTNTLHTGSAWVDIFHKLEAGVRCIIGKMSLTSIGAIFALLGCASDQNVPVSSTKHRLNVIRTIVSRVAQRVDLSQANDLKEILDIAYKHEIIDKAQYDRGDFERDYWGRDFQFEKEHIGDRLKVRVTSKGKDGVYQREDGDDLYIEVDIVLRPRD